MKTKVNLVIALAPADKFHSVQFHFIPKTPECTTKVCLCCWVL